MKYEFKPCLHFHSCLFLFIPLYSSCEDACLCSVHSRLLSRVGERAMRIARAMCGRTDLDCICLRIRIRMEIRKETGHEQWLAALRNNVVFVGSFYLLRQECSLQSASKFMYQSGCTIWSNRSSRLLLFVTELNYRPLPMARLVLRTLIDLSPIPNDTRPCSKSHHDSFLQLNQQLKRDDR